MSKNKDDKCCDCNQCEVQASFAMTAVRANEAASQASILANQTFQASQQMAQAALLRQMYPSLTIPTP